MCFFLLYKYYAQIFTGLYDSKYLKLDLPAGKMNAKTKINIYRKVIEEVSNKYEGAGEFIQKKINELCSEHGISTEEVRLYILHILATYTV